LAYEFVCDQYKSLILDKYFAGTIIMVDGKQG